ncbi:hypothetical protein [Roseateles violae]|uniref:YggT family protein n=1 Tax=Roseateles violae TaxID=3058042 RepID=A0ABT8DRE1_9BURK|nr:hypothetical protein [Pelomonas sp. PFR6]MDN3920752.1 hypothetical protein [Pelomonas sp. PFR6]
MLLVLTLFKMLAEIALCALAGQGLLALLLGAGRAGNPIYRLFEWLSAPLLAGTRRLLPRLAPQRLPTVTALLLFLVWLLATGLKIRHCLAIGPALCR